MPSGSSDFAAMNFGMQGHAEHDLRYYMADEYMESARPVGLVGTGRDHRRRKSGCWSITARSTPSITTASISARRSAELRARAGRVSRSSPKPAARRAGRKFAAAHADTIVAMPGIEAMRAYRDDVHKHMVAQGRKLRLQGAVPHQSDPGRGPWKRPGAQAQAGLPCMGTSTSGWRIFGR